MVNRIVIAAPNSSSGKTTISVGLMAALAATGQRVAGFKVGPDYIDPGYHALATGRPGRNLDAWLVGTERIAPLLAHGAQDAEIAVIEGVMGLYDGRLGTTEGRRGFGSTAHIAELISAPVILIADTRGVSRTLAASIHGLATHPDAPRVGGVILNRTGSGMATDELLDAFTEVGLPVLGAVPRNAELAVPSRHLGLIPAAERDEAQAFVQQAAALVADHVDLDAIRALAASAPPLTADPWRPDLRPVTAAAPPRIAVAAGRAFTFRYAETTELLTAAGCEVVEFDPLNDPTLPPGTSGLYLGGGFPEVHAEELAANRPLLTEIRAAIDAGLPTYAECAGLLYLCRDLDGLDMADALPLTAQMTPRLALGYRELTATIASAFTEPGERFRSHEFHRTATTAIPNQPPLDAAWLVNGERSEGVGTANLLASYQHLHWAGHPELAQRFADAAAAFATGGNRWSVPHRVTRRPGPDLRHHGDAQLRPGLIDLAVNVRSAPEWLLTALTADPQRWAAYPDAQPARQALAARHGLPIDQVLPTAGAADAFTLIARTFPGRRVAIVHPQFTEPEVAWRAADHQVRRIILRPEDGFRLDADLVPADSDLVVIGNPTNPTGALHAATEIRRLARPGRIVVVDEAFMDFVPGETESLLTGDLAGILVTRSLTKIWGIAGLRAGFIGGDASLVAELACQQEPWAVSTPALDAMVATASEQARRHVAETVDEVAQHRRFLVEALRDAGFPAVGEPQTPFVLVNTASLSDESVHAALAEAGFAVRRCDSFPGLGPTWLRLAVREPEISRAMVAALGALGRQLPGQPESLG